MWTDIVRMMNNFRLCRSSVTGSFLSHFLNYQIVYLVSKNYKIFLLNIDNQNDNKKHQDLKYNNPLERYFNRHLLPTSRWERNSEGSAKRGKAKYFSIARI